MARVLRPAPAPGPDEYDCQACGACCCARPEARAIGYRDYVQVKRTDRLWQKKPLLWWLTVRNDEGEKHMKLVGPTQRCVALVGRIGRRVACGIYELRPGVCRGVQAGGKECLERRRERGMPAAGPLVELGRRARAG